MLMMLLIIGGIKRKKSVLSTKEKTYCSTHLVWPIYGLDKNMKWDQLKLIMSQSNKPFSFMNNNVKNIVCSTSCLFVELFHWEQWEGVCGWRLLGHRFKCILLQSWCVVLISIARKVFFMYIGWWCSQLFELLIAERVYCALKIKHIS